MSQVHRFVSSLGTVTLHALGDALTKIHVGDEQMEATSPPSPLLLRAEEQLNAYFQGRLRNFDLPIAPQGTEMQKQVWTFLQTIPYGATRSYGQVARALGRPTASRAVGAANGRNPLWILVPCHRVIGSSGSLTGYAGGIERKRWLLDLETFGRPGPLAGVVQAAGECRSLSPRAPQSSIFCPAKDARSPLAS